MKKLLIVLLFLYIGCGSHAPPKPPTPQPEPEPPPINLCGNGVCDAGETPANCAKDCKEDPTPDPEPVCGDEPLDPDCPKIKNDFTINKILGVYIGVDGTPDFDWIWLMSTLDKNNSFNWVYVHLNSPWANQGMYMWEFDATRKLYTKKWDERYWRQFRLMARAAGYYDIGLNITFLNEYCNTKWATGPTAKHQSPFHPFRNNLAKTNLCGDGKGNAPLYRNWNRKLPLDKNVAWMKWADENDISTFKPTNIAGEMIFEMADKVIEELKPIIKEYPNLKLTFRPANEPWRYVLPDQKSFDEGRGNPLDDRTFTFFFQKLDRAGLKNGNNIRYVVEEEFLQDGAYINSYWTDKTYRQYTAKRNYLYEFHNVVEIKNRQWTNDQFRGEDIEFFTNILKMDHRLVLFSNDGDKGEKFDPKNYYKRLKQIYQWQQAHPGSWFDYKVPSDVPPCQWKPKDIESNLRCILPQMQKEIFGK